MADPRGVSDPVFLGVLDYRSEVLSEHDSLSEYGDFLPNPWKCPYVE